MMVTNEIASITALAPYGDEFAVKYDIIPFRVFQHAETYLAVPLVPDEVRTRMNLPGQLKFQFINNHLVSLSNGNQELLGNIVRELRLLHVI